MHLIIFDRRPQIAWEEKIWQREAYWQDKPIGVCR